MVAVLLAGFMLAGCGPGPTIDGWTVGSLQTCPEPNVPLGDPWPEVWDCGLALSQWLSAATEGFDRRDPAHLAIVRTTLHDEGVLVTRSSTIRIAVFELADGSVHAIGVGHGGIATDKLVTVDDGP